MARREPGRRLEIWKHPKFGVEVEIRFDTGHGLFWGWLGDVRFAGKILEDVRSQLKKAVEEGTDIKWIAILEVDTESSIDNTVKVAQGRGGGFSIVKAEWADQTDNGKNHINIDYERYWVAWVGNKWMKCNQWQAPDKTNKGHGVDRRFLMTEWYAMAKENGDVTFPFEKPASRYEDGPTLYLPYSQSLWDSLVVVGVRLGELSDRLNTLLSTEDGRARLESATTGLLLPAPQEETES